MSRLALPLAMFVLFLVEGTIFQVLFSGSTSGGWQFVPHFMFILIVLTGIFRGRSHGLFYSIMFGVLYDIVYGPVLGVYTFGFALFTYLFSLSFSSVKRSLRMLTAVVMTAVIFLEYYSYGMMSILGITTQAHDSLFLDRFLPTFLMNLAVAAFMVMPVRYWFYSVDGRSDDR
ncbi:rod shape-determining protein MreD [Alkalicoccus halolimnae]|uniref:Rod shape-determining protein MreD n=1 Tax=Alkalicoccus halolimnae TaxID=1667239 RepID=A0A5C7F598_9BACI|nr:rod shape-determining protein MreD [Alkalicoccus halolimnae]TXF85841.1 rod shape-determining protein MreD [Alkalicoccus halolimnae]